MNQTYKLGKQIRELITEDTCTSRDIVTVSGICVWEFIKNEWLSISASTSLSHTASS